MKTSLKQLPHLFAAIALASGSVVSAADAAKPNIIFVISDDHRWDAIGAAGNPNIRTPNLDRLAREGVYFPQATVTNPQCTTSRAALITGMASHANGRYSNQTARRDVRNPRGFEKYDCLPEVLGRAGYVTANVGKWHMETDPWHVGFQKTGTWFPPGAGRYKNAPVAKGQSREMSPSEGFLQERFGDSAVQLLREHADSNSTQPIFLWVAMTAPHGPFGPNPEAAEAPYRGKSAQDLIPPGYKGNMHHKGAKWPEYYAAITSVDNEVGRILKTLDDTGMSSNTVVVFMGDNGFLMGSRDLGGKAVPYEASIRVPYIIWGPGVVEGKGKTDAVASSLDLPVTLAKLAGAQPPKAWHGRDLTPTLADAKAHGTTWSVTEMPDYDNWKFPNNGYRTVRTTAGKLIVWAPQNKKAPEFYDLTTDPHEEKNLYTDPAMQPRVKELTQVLEKWMKDTNDSWEMRGPLSVQRGPENEEVEPGKGKRKRARSNASSDD